MPSPGVPALPSQGLIDGRVRLRALTSHDVELLRQLSREADVVRWTSYPADLDEVRALARIGRGHAVADRAVFCVAELDGQPAGTCGAGVGEIDGNIEIFYAVLPWARRQGVASSAASMLVSAALTAGAATVSLVTHLANTGSPLVARRAGFVPLRQERRVVKGLLTDVQLWRWEGGGE
jgi:RimJ/RimL family protein N-acetyltransferase